LEDLKRQYKDFIEPKEHKNLKEELNNFDNQVRVLQKEKQHLVKMFDTLSKERDTSKTDADKAKKEKSLLQIEVTKMT
jgi:hypothetical protein